MEAADHLASHRHCVGRIHDGWAPFLERRAARLAEGERHGKIAERVTENILEDLFTSVLDWTLADVSHQVGYADLLLTRLGIKYMVLEAKRPGALAWNRRAVDAALDQGRRYAEEQRVRTVAVSDGVMLYVADLAHGGLRDRVFASLEDHAPEDELWWVSVHGIYRPREDVAGAALRLLLEQPVEASAASASEAAGSGLLHPKYHLAAHCFAFVGNAADPHTWKLPYLCADGAVDVRRLPKAVQAILSNYRGVKVGGIPDPAIPDVLVRLALAAKSLGRMPFQAGESAPVYEQLEQALEQLERLEAVRGPT